MTQFRESRGKSFISLGGEGKDQPADGIVVKLTVWLLNGDWESATRNPWLQGVLHLALGPLHLVMVWLRVFPPAGKVPGKGR